MILNWYDEISKIDPSVRFRSAGGWLKTVTELDKNVTNGYSFVGDFVKAGDFNEKYEDGLYLDCNKEGKKSKPNIDYKLFRLKDGKLSLLDEVMGAERNWAQDFWKTVEEELEIEEEREDADKIVSLIINKTNADIELLKEVQKKLAISIEELN